MDYPLELTYGGELPRFGVLSRVRFPLLRTVNIGVELSQVRLYLPPDQRWLGFGGTMRAVAEEADLEAGNLSYLTKMTQRLTDSLRGEDPFAQTRAQANPRPARSGSTSNYRPVDLAGNTELKREYSANAVALREAQQQAAALQQPAATAPMNRQQLNTFYIEQENGRAALNVVDRLGDNFKPDDSTLRRGAAPRNHRERKRARTGQFDALPVVL